MKNNWLVLVFTALIVSCGSPQKNEVDQWDSTKTYYTKKDLQPKMGSMGIIHPSGCKYVIRFCDTLVNGMILGDSASIAQKIGTNPPKIAGAEKMDFPENCLRTRILTKSNSQMLTIYFFEGFGVPLKEVQIEYCDPGIAGNKTLSINDEEFITGKGIKLGMTEKEVVGLFGKPNETAITKNTKKYSYQEYNGFNYGDYYFENGILVKFRFGKRFVICT